MKPVFAPMARPAMIVPSITECGSSRKMTWSLQVPGSDSSPFTSTYFGFALCFGTKLHFIPVGKPAAPTQSAGLHLVDDPVGPVLDRLLYRLVAVELQILIDVRSALAKTTLQN